MEIAFFHKLTVGGSRRTVSKIAKQLKNRHFVSDIVVITGTLIGIIKNKTYLVIIFLYLILTLNVIDWGIPNETHPFTYHMDEWHFSQAIRSVVKYGTTTKDGVAQTPFFHPVSAGVFISPFVFFKIIDLNSIKNSTSGLIVQMHLFQILRLHTILFGLLSLFVLKKIAEYMSLSTFITIFLFTSTPIWFTLSNYFKYDIALTFWILVSLYFLLRYISKKSLNNYLYSGISIGLALATKFTALPLLIIYFISFFWFEKQYKKKINNLIIGFASCFLTFLIIGIPHLLTGKADYWELFNSVVLNSPNDTYNYVLGMNYWLYLGTGQLMTIFGHPFYLFSIISISYFVIKLVTYFKNRNTGLNKYELFIFLSLCIFVISLIPLKISATGNRALVLLPFLTLTISIFLEKIINSFHKLKIMILVLISVLFITQFVESISWMSLKWAKDPREISSEWIISNISDGTKIGLENIPIYQMIPNIFLKEYYFNNKNNNRYQYEIVNNQTQKLPSVVIVSNKEFYTKYVVQSSKKNLLKRLEKEGYKNTITFYPEWQFNELFVSRRDFYISSLIPIPTLSVFEKL